MFNCQCDQMQNCEGGCETIYIALIEVDICCCQVPRFHKGLPVRSTVPRRIQKDLRQLFPRRRRLAIRRSRVPYFRHEQRRDDRLPRVSLRAERDVTGKAGGQAQVGVQHVRSGRERVHFQTGDARDRQRERI